MNNYDTNNKYKNILFCVCVCVFVFFFFFARMLNEDYVIMKREMSFDKVWGTSLPKLSTTLEFQLWSVSWAIILGLVLNDKDSCKKIEDLKFFHKRTVSFFLGASLLTQLVKETAQSLGREDALEKEMATHSSILAWRIPWTEEPGRLQFMGSQGSDTT